MELTEEDVESYAQFVKWLVDTRAPSIGPQASTALLGIHRHVRPLAATIADPGVRRLATAYEAALYFVATVSGFHQAGVIALLEAYINASTREPNSD